MEKTFSGIGKMNQILSVTNGWNETTLRVQFCLTLMGEEGSGKNKLTKKNINCAKEPKGNFGKFDPELIFK